RGRTPPFGGDPRVRSRWLRSGIGRGDRARAGAAGGGVDAGYCDRDRCVRLDEGVPPVQVAGGEGRAHRLHHALGPLAGGLRSFDGGAGGGERGEVGRRLGAVAGDDRGAEVQPDDEDRRDRRDAHGGPDRGAAALAPAVPLAHGGAVPGSTAATARLPTRTGKGRRTSADTSATTRSPSVLSVRSAPVGASRAATARPRSASPRAARRASSRAASTQRMDPPAAAMAPTAMTRNTARLHTASAASTVTAPRSRSSADPHRRRAAPAGARAPIRSRPSARGGRGR